MAQGRGGKEKRRKLGIKKNKTKKPQKMNKNEQKLRVAWLVCLGFFSPPLPICNGFCRDIKIKEGEIGSKSLSSFSGSRKHHWHLSLGRARTTPFLAVVKAGFSLKSS